MARCAYCSTIEVFLKKGKDSFVAEMESGSTDITVSSGDSEITSWENNYERLKDLLKDVNKEACVAFEFICPGGGGRIDCMLFGKDKDNKDQVVLIELKQWDNNNVSTVEDVGDYQRGKVFARLAQFYEGIHDHPSKQAYGYECQIRNNIALFDEERAELNSFAYCYNYYEYGDINYLFDEQYESFLNSSPLYCADTEEDFAEALKIRLCSGHGTDVFDRFSDAEIKPTKSSMERFKGVIKGNDRFNFIGDESKAEDTILNAIRDAEKDPDTKQVVIVEGGPGTGKTIVALQVLADLIAKDNNKQFIYATRSSALRESLMGIIGYENNSVIARDIYSFNPKEKREGEIDVLLIDEAHRISNKGNSYFHHFVTPEGSGQGSTTYLRQTSALIYSSKVCVFFIDDKQAISNTEVGSSRMIKDISDNYKKYYEEDRKAHRNNLEKVIGKINQLEASGQQIGNKLATKKTELRKLKQIADVEPKITKVNCRIVNLKAQFRCAGSDNYIDWIDRVLYESHDKLKAEHIKLSGDYPFGVCDSPKELEDIIRYLDKEDAQDTKDICTARLTAGYCWKWSNTLESGKTDMVKDVAIGDWAMPWETPDGISLPRELSKIYPPKAILWPTDKRGINQVGSITCVQGFDFDYAGVILGPDITYDESNDCIKIPNNQALNYDKKVRCKEHWQYELLIRNIYRVLMTRGKKGCFIYCCDKPLNDYFKQLLKESDPHVTDEFERIKSDIIN